VTIRAGVPPAPGVVDRPDIDAQLISWLLGESGQYFHLLGPPGSGKTSWIRRLVQRGAIGNSSVVPMAVVAAHHFCRWDDAASSSAVGFLQRISQQLAQLDPVYETALRERAEKSRNISATLVQHVRDSPNAHIEGPRIESIVIQSERPADVIDDLLKAPLSEALAGPGPLWLLVVDAPDEPDPPDIARLLLTLGELPTRLRIIVATRPNKEMERGLTMLGACSCSLSELPGTVNSIAHYLRSEATGYGLERRLSSELDFEGLMQGLIARAGTNFLVARCALQALSGSGGLIDIGMVRGLPADLSGYFRLFLGRLDLDTRGRWQTEAGPILGALAVAQAPLPEADLVSLCRLSAGVARSYVTRLRPFLEAADENCWRLFHATLAEFLLDEKDAEEFWCPAKEQHDRFVHWVVGSPGLLCDWKTVSDYGVKHILHHIAEADGTDAVLQIDAVVSEDYVKRRANSGATAFDLSSDFRRSLIAVSKRGCVKETLFMALLVVYWQDRIASDANPSSTILLAAQGHTEKAVDLALRQNEVAHESAYETIRLQAEFASHLVRLGEIDAAFDFSRRLGGNAQIRTYQAAFNALVLENPEKALVIRSGNARNEPLELESDAFRALAAHPPGLELAISAAGSDESLVRVAEGCSKHDLDKALELVVDVDIHSWWLGGERDRFARYEAFANVLAAFLSYNPDRVEEAWERASLLLESTWPTDYGLVLAGRFAEASTDLGRLAIERLQAKNGSLAHGLAVVWLGSMGGAELFKALVGNFKRSFFVKSNKKLSHYGERAGLRDLIRQLALVEPSRIPRGSAPFNLMKVIAERVLLLLADEPDVPESKAGGARVLGKFAAWLDDDLMTRLFQHGTERWINEGWQHECGEGFAASLARRGVSSYIVGRNLFSGYPSWHGAMMVAADIICCNDPRDVVALIDSVEIRHFKTRASLIGKGAIAMKRAGVGSLATLASRLSPYVAGAQFEDLVEVLRSVETPRAEPMDQLILTKKAVDAAIQSGDLAAMRNVIRSVETLSDILGVPFEGETIWAKNLRRSLAGALARDDPVSSLRLLVPIASVDDFRAFATEFLVKRPHLRDPKLFGTWVLRTLQPSEPSWESTYWIGPFATGLALALPGDTRSDFLAAISGKGSSNYAQVVSNLSALDDPIGTLNRASSNTEPVDDCLEWAIPNAVAALAERGDKTVFARLDGLSERYIRNEPIMISIGEHWPTESWESCLSAYNSWQNTNSRQRRTFSRFSLSWILDELLPRVAVTDPRRAFDAVDQVKSDYPDVVDEARLLRRMIGRVAGSSSPNASYWPALLSAASKIADASPQGYALLDMLSATRRLPATEARQPACRTIAALALGPREFILNNVEAVVRTAAAIDHGVRKDLIGFVGRLRSLLAVNLEG
jgi:hypothetical protein